MLNQQPLNTVKCLTEMVSSVMNAEDYDSKILVNPCKDIHKCLVNIQTAITAITQQSKKLTQMFQELQDSLITLIKSEQSDRKFIDYHLEAMNIKMKQDMTSLSQSFQELDILEPFKAKNNKLKSVKIYTQMALHKCLAKCVQLIQSSLAQPHSINKFNIDSGWICKLEHQLGKFQAQTHQNKRCIENITQLLIGFSGEKCQLTIQTIDDNIMQEKPNLINIKYDQLKDSYNGSQYMVPPQEVISRQSSNTSKSLNIYLSVDRLRSFDDPY